MSAEVRRAASVPEWKIRDVDDLVEQISKSRVVAVVGIREIPASGLQEMRSDLRSKAEIRVVRNNIALRAIELSGAGLQRLADYVEDQTAFIFSDINPFKLNKILAEGKRPMPLRAGGRSPKEIVVEAGETSFSPGPMVGKLQSAGIPAAIKGGKVVINQRTVLAKEGEVVSLKLAEILQLMEIYPKDVGLELRAVYEGGLVFPAKDLMLDVEGTLSDLGTAAAKAFGFALEIGYTTPDTIAPLLQRAQTRARGLVAEGAVPVPGMMVVVLARALANASAIAAATGKSQSSPAGQEAPVEVAPEVEEEEEKEEEDVAAGLGSLFG